MKIGRKIKLIWKFLFGCKHLKRMTVIFTGNDESILWEASVCCYCGNEQYENPEHAKKANIVREEYKKSEEYKNYSKKKQKKLFFRECFETFVYCLTILAIILTFPNIFIFQFFLSIWVLSRLLDIYFPPFLHTIKPYPWAKFWQRRDVIESFIIGIICYFLVF